MGSVFEGTGNRASEFGLFGLAGTKPMPDVLVMRVIH